MNTSKPLLFARVFGRDRTDAQPAANLARPAGRVSKSEIRDLFSDVFEDKGLARYRRSVEKTAKAA